MELEQDIVPLVIRALASDTLMAGSASIEDIDMPRSTNPDQLTRHDLFVESCMFHARMRRVLSPIEYAVLVAKYSPCFKAKLKAASKLAAHIKSPAPARFKHTAIITWAIPKPRGNAKRVSTVVLPDNWYLMDNWCDEPVPVKTQERWRRKLYFNLGQLIERSLIKARAICIELK